MAIVWNEKLDKAWDKSYYSLKNSTHTTVTVREECRKKFILNDSSLTKEEKDFLISELRKVHDKLRIGNKSERKRQCDDCKQWRQATQYCEFCIRKYLENDFENWTSGNDKIDILIRECQRKSVSPQNVVEWINYDQFENVQHLAEGGWSSVYTALWKGGHYHKWNSENQTLERFGRHKVVLKTLFGSNCDSVKWFQEVSLIVVIIILFLIFVNLR